MGPNGGRIAREDATMATLIMATPLMHPGPWGDGGWHGGWFLLFPLFWIFWILIIWLLFATVIRRRVGRGGWPGGWAGSAESVLGERFARGEIDESEYRSRLAVLRPGRRR